MATVLLRNVRLGNKAAPALRRFRTRSTTTVDRTTPGRPFLDQPPDFSSAVVVIISIRERSARGPTSGPTTLHFGHAEVEQRPVDQSLKPFQPAAPAIRRRARPPRVRGRAVRRMDAGVDDAGTRRNPDPMVRTPVE